MPVNTKNSLYVPKYSPDDKRMGQQHILNYICYAKIQRKPTAPCLTQLYVEYKVKWSIIRYVTLRLKYTI